MRNETIAKLQENNVRKETEQKPAPLPVPPRPELKKEEPVDPNLEIIRRQRAEIKKLKEDTERQKREHTRKLRDLETRRERELHTYFKKNWDDFTKQRGLATKSTPLPVFGELDKHIDHKSANAKQDNENRAKRLADEQAERDRQVAERKAE